MELKFSLWICFLFFFVRVCAAQDSVDVTFRYMPSGSPGVVYLPGEFNSWGHNSNGVIPSNDPSLMVRDPGTGVWTKTVRLRVGGNPSGGVSGAYQYKINENGTRWLADPLNPRTNPGDAGNSYLYVTNPTIYQFVPNQVTGATRTSNPIVSTYLFPKAGSQIDTGTIVLKVDARTYSGLGSSYDPSTQQLVFRIPDRLENGSHSMWLTVAGVSDSASFLVQAGFVRITNLGDFTTRIAQRTLYGTVADTTLHEIEIVRNGVDTLGTVPSAGQFSVTAQLREGINSFTALVRDNQGTMQSSDPVVFTYLVNHAPDADIAFVDIGSKIIFSAQASDPDSGQTQKLIYQWFVDTRNPQPLPDVLGATGSQIFVSKPTGPGEYYVTLIAADPDGNKDTTRSFFTISSGGGFQTSTRATVPQWVKQGRLYEMFFKSMTPQGTIQAALVYLPYLKSLGVNIIWLMPIMENASPINNRTGPGYNIKNFVKVAPEYGTNDDFKEFVRQAHALGIRIILDVTPNHTSFQHPFVLEARQFRQSSPYWNFYQHSYIEHNTNGLGQSSTADGFYYYTGFSDQLLNYNWSDLDARSYMIEVYKWWVKEFDIDGYRFDVYWGPHRRAGGGAGNELEMGAPVRKALKKMKPDLFLLAEDDGTGQGTEVIFADRNGGVDAGYDWNLYGNAIKPFAFDYGAVEALHGKYYNNNYYPGSNASFMRFMENHDEERIVALANYGTYQRTMPMATTLFTLPGMPLIYSGQEVGYGLGIADFYQRTRGVIDWNAQGKSVLMPHYQRLAQIRAQYSTFSSQKLNRLASGSDLVYAYVRPQNNSDAVVTVNFASVPQSISLNLSQTSLETPYISGRSYYASDLHNDTSYSLIYNSGFTLQVTLKPYGSLVCIVSDSIKRLNLPLLVGIHEDRKAGWPTDYRLSQNFPNPFNPSTTIRYELPAESWVNVRVFNLLGEEVSTLVDERQGAGAHEVRWNALRSVGSPCASGVYFVRIEAGSFVDVKRMLLLK